MRDAASTHPSLEELTAFDRGNLRLAEREVVERHIAGCDACCHRLDSIGDDDLIALLRTSVGLMPTVALKDTGDLSRPAGERTPIEPPAELIDHPRYRILGPLGAGGMGIVFKAEHRLMERTVALKIIQKSLTERSEAVERFRQEVKAAARLSHPNIVTAYDAEQAGDLHFLVMEYIEGANLEQLVQSQGPLPVALACDIIRQAALGLQHAHERGMVHRDIKPQNLLRTPAGQVKILDFGLARFRSETGGSLTASGIVLGTPDYVAPEQALDARRADERADIYSLGCTLYFLLTGRPPFPEGSALHKLMAHQQHKPPPLADIRPDVPAALPRILERMMAKDVAERYQTPAEVGEQLAPFVSGDAMPSPLVLRDRAEASGPRKRWLAAPLVAAVVLAALGIGGFLLAQLILQRNNPRPLSPETLDSFGDSSLPFARAAIRADCRLALVARAGNLVYLWDLTKGEEIGRLEGHVDRPMGLAFSADGRHAASSGMDGFIRLWDLQQRRLTTTLDNRAIWIRGVDFWGTNGRVVSGDNRARVVIWDAAAGQSSHELNGHQALLYDLKVSGDWAISASDDRTARVWDLRQRRQMHCLRGHEKAVTCAVLSRDGRFALTGSADQSVRFWDTATEKAVQVFRGHTAGVNVVVLSSDRRRALSGDHRGFIRVWDLEKGEEVRHYQEPNGGIIRDIAFCPDGRRILSADAGGMFRFWRLP